MVNNFVRALTRIQDQDDFEGTLTDGLYLKWDDASSKFVLDSTPQTPPGGSGTEIQYRSSASTFGGVLGSSWDGTMLTLPFGSSNELRIDGGGVAQASIWTSNSYGGMVSYGTRNDYKVGIHVNNNWPHITVNSDGTLTQASNAAVATNAAYFHQFLPSDKVGHRIDLVSGQTADALQINSYGGSGGNKASIAADGTIYSKASTAPWYAGRFAGANGAGIASDGAGNLHLLGANSHQAMYFSSYVANLVWSDFVYRWADTVNIGGNLNASAADTGFSRNAPGVIEVNNGTAGQYRDLVVRSIGVGGSPSGSTGDVGANNTTLHRYSAGRILTYVSATPVVDLLASSAAISVPTTINAASGATPLTLKTNASGATASYLKLLRESDSYQFFEMSVVNGTGLVLAETGAGAIRSRSNYHMLQNTTGTKTPFILDTEAGALTLYPENAVGLLVTNTGVNSAIQISATASNSQAYLQLTSENSIGTAANWFLVNRLGANFQLQNNAGSAVVEVTQSGAATINATSGNPLVLQSNSILRFVCDNEGAIVLSSVSGTPLHIIMNGNSRFVCHSSGAMTTLTPNTNVDIALQINGLNYGGGDSPYAVIQYTGYGGANVAILGNGYLSLKGSTATGVGIGFDNPGIYSLTTKSDGSSDYIELYANYGGWIWYPWRAYRGTGATGNRKLVINDSEAADTSFIVKSPTTINAASGNPLTVQANGTTGLLLDSNRQLTVTSNNSGSAALRITGTAGSVSQSIRIGAGSGFDYILSRNNGTGNFEIIGEQGGGCTAYYFYGDGTTSLVTKVLYDTANYFSTTVDANANTTFDLTTASGTPHFVFNKNISCPTFGGGETFGNGALTDGGAYPTAIGTAAYAESYAVSVGRRARGYGQEAVAIGSDAGYRNVTRYAGYTAIGHNTKIGGNYSIALGDTAETTAANQCVIGSTSYPINALRLITDGVGGYLNFGVSSGNLTVTPSGGKVGIGAAPDTGVHLKGSTGDLIKFRSESTTNGGPAYELKNTEGHFSVMMDSTPNMHLYDVTNGHYRLSIAQAGSGGAVQIGNYGDTIFPRHVTVNGTISCPGAGTGSERFGLSATAAGNYAAVFGNSATGAGVNTCSFGTGASADGSGGTAFGYSSNGDANYSLAIGYQATVAAAYAGSIALGNATATAANQMIAGSTSVPINALKLITDGVGGSCNFGISSGNLTITPSGGQTDLISGLGCFRFNYDTLSWIYNAGATRGSVKFAQIDSWFTTVSGGTGGAGGVALQHNSTTRLAVTSVAGEVIHYYDATNKVTSTVSSSGNLTISPSGNATIITGSPISGNCTALTASLNPVHSSGSGVALKGSFSGITIGAISTNFSNADAMTASDNQILYQGTGTVENMTGVRGLIHLNNGGTVVTARALEAQVNNTGSTITTGYGLYIYNINASTSYGVYQAGTDDVNYFAGAINCPGAGNGSVRLGQSSLAGGINAVTIGCFSNSTNTGSVSLGNYIGSTGAYSIAIGYAAQALHDNSIAIGGSATAPAGGTNQIVIGTNSTAAVINSVILIGNNNNWSTATVGSGGMIGIGRAMVLGSTNMSGSVTIGDLATGYVQAVVIGSSAIGNSTSVSVGYQANAQDNGVVIGASANNASGLKSTVVGYNAIDNGGNGGVVIGAEAQSTNQLCTVLGRTASSSGIYGVAIGYSATVAHTGGIAMGYGSATTANNQMVVGSTGVPINALKLITDGVGGSLNFGVSSGNVTITPSGGITNFSGSLVTSEIIGSTNASGTLTFKSTSHATKGKIYFGEAGTSVYDEVNERWGFGTASPSFQFHVEGSTGGIYLNRLGGAGFQPFILLASNGAGGGQLRGVEAGGLSFTNFGATTEWARIGSTGLVGINQTPSSTAQLAVTGSGVSVVPLRLTGAASINTNYAEINSSSGTNGDVFVIDKTGKVGVAITSTDLAATYSTASLQVRKVSNSLQTHAIRIADATSASHPYALIGFGWESVTYIPKPCAAFGTITVDGANFGQQGFIWAAKSSNGNVDLEEIMRVGPTSIIYLGNGPQASSPSSGTLSATSGSGTNIAGANLTIAGGRGTGNAAGGNIIFSASTVGSSGSSLQSLAEKMRVAPGGVGVECSSPFYSTNAKGMFFGSAVTGNGIHLGADAGGISTGQWSLQSQFGGTSGAHGGNNTIIFNGYINTSGVYTQNQYYHAFMFQHDLGGNSLRLAHSSTGSTTSSYSTVLETGAYGTIGISQTSSSSAQLAVTAASATITPLRLTGAATPSVNYLEINSSSGSNGDVFFLDSSGLFGTRSSATATQDFTTAMRRSRGSTSSPTVVQSGDNLGSFLFAGYDGSAWQYCAGVECYVDATPGAGDMPARLSFLVTPDGSATRAAAMTIKNNGDVLIGTATPVAGSKLVVNGTAQATRFNGAAEVSNTPSGTTQTIDFITGHHQKLDLSSASGDVTLTLDNPPNAGVLVIFISQGATARDITWPGTVTFIDSAGEPTWNADTNLNRIVTLYWNGSTYYASASSTF